MHAGVRRNGTTRQSMLSSARCRLQLAPHVPKDSLQGLEQVNGCRLWHQPLAWLQPGTALMAPITRYGPLVLRAVLALLAALCVPSEHRQVRCANVYAVLCGACARSSCSFVPPLVDAVAASTPPASGMLLLRLTLHGAPCRSVQVHGRQQQQPPAASARHESKGALRAAGFALHAALPPWRADRKLWRVRRCVSRGSMAAPWACLPRAHLTGLTLSGSPLHRQVQGVVRVVHVPSPPCGTHNPESSSGFCQHVCFCQPADCIGGRGQGVRGPCLCGPCEWHPCPRHQALRAVLRQPAARARASLGEGK